MIGKDQSPDIGNDTQWKQGQSGNPDGKPKGALHLSTRIKNMLNDDDFTTKMLGKDGKEVNFKGNPAEAIIRTAVLKAMSGDKNWADWIANNGYGSKLVHSNDPDSPMTEVYDPNKASRYAEWLKQDTKRDD